MFKFYISSLEKWNPLLAKNHLNFTITLKYSQLQDLFSFCKWDRHEKHFISQNVERIVLQISLLSLHYIIFHIFPLVFVSVWTFFLIYISTYTYECFILHTWSQSYTCKWSISYKHGTYNTVTANVIYTPSHMWV